MLRSFPVAGRYILLRSLNKGGDLYVIKTINFIVHVCTIFHRNPFTVCGHETNEGKLNLHLVFVLYSFSTWIYAFSCKIGLKYFSGLQSRRLCLFWLLCCYPNGRGVWGVGLRPIACWDCGFESRWVYGCLSLVSVVCCQSSLRLADLSSRRFLPTVVYHCVSSGNT